ncbi:PREDICTED: putative leucine-rich repeat receptor-like protein kinase At2g19210 [Fragaria vesca subsp. vesca]|uniref:putative leucine-rich repeat receptor-like protein kinase At2g19210 n=1 Tax=Fragaria vesca subsp. vesca TaxID=101020 RepID=UPI0002C35C75|nr:PREDICTED: putative leucine-rich repeat receptor-like protein kinase At2g19210 [Fragaria vesca subsp. vesca]
MLLRLNKQILFALLGGLSLILLVHAQDEDQSGFISIDCGRTENSSYTEQTTGINYISDTGFVDTGESKLVLRYVKDFYQQRYWGVRSFPEGIRNCYKINVTTGDKYLIRVSFVYGNYDGKGKLPTFLLYLGTNLWDSVKVRNESYVINKELIHVAPQNYIHVCLVNNGSGVPFISAIELRPLTVTSYPTQTGSLALNWRLDIGQTGPDLKSYRYPKDIHDRFWDPYEDVDNVWFTLNTSSTVDFDGHNLYEPASVVMSTAATAKNATDPLMLRWDPPVDANDTKYYVYMHFAEIEVQANESRWQYITNNGKPYMESFAASYLYTTTIYSTKPQRGSQNFSIIKAENSTLPPSINGLEIYTLKEFLELETNQDDVEAIINIKSAYEITKNWQGDPCLPLNYSWEGIKCNYLQSDSPRIISLDLSSSGLTGEISPSISNLAMIKTLDLSNNNLTGPIPDFLSQLRDLNILNLENNKFTGSLPLGLTEKINNDLLTISLCDNPNLAGSEPCKTKKNKNKIIIPIIGAIAGISALILAGAVFLCFCKRKRKNVAMNPKPNPGSVELEQKNRKFTYSEILKITNNRQRVLGKGGFGTVYHGYIDDKTQVAVKLLSQTSSQGLQQFHAEVHLLMRVHHTNLTSLVGYCDDELNKGLVYEYMANGNLQAYLSDKTSDVLTWEGRLQIATEAAQGLEYLHYGCKPPMIHRDVKSTNILLSEKFQAKLSDFGLSRNFAPGDRDGTHIVTGVAGTPGYLAPEYHQSNRLNEKSDVYSFGIVLLEIITGRPVYTRTNGERTHITRWVELMLPRGDIYSIIDPMLERNFNVNSAWKAVETAMACVSAEPSKRPVMSTVVMELKECLASQLDLTNFNSEETALGSSSIYVSQNNSIMMMRPSVR